MIRKILAALLIGGAIVALDRPDEAEKAARDAIGTAGDAAREAIVERCRTDPAACL